MNKKIDFKIISTMENPAFGTFAYELVVDGDPIIYKPLMSSRQVSIGRAPYHLSEDKELFIRYAFSYEINVSPIIEDYKKYGGKNATD